MAFRTGRHSATQTYDESDEGSLATHGFNANTGGSPIVIGNTNTIIASVTVTPQFTGKFRVTAMAVVSNADDSIHMLTLKLGHGAGPTIDFTGAAQSIGSTVNQPAQTAIQGEYGSAVIPTTFPLGTPVQLDLVGAQSINDTNITVATDGAQIIAEEIS